jgi:hypothetical protein
MSSQGQRGAAVIVMACGWAALSAQTLTVDPARSMSDEVVSIRDSGLDAGERVAIHVELVDGAAHHWASQAEFAADLAGGSYKEVSAMGIVWSTRDLGRLLFEFRLLRKGKAAAPPPGVLVVGGSNGGVPARPVAWLALHGIVALALGYWSGWRVGRRSAQVSWR